MIDWSRAVWRKSSRSNHQGQCVEVAGNFPDVAGNLPGVDGNLAGVVGNLPGVVGVRDSKDPAGPVLAISPAGWSAFVTATRTGAFAPHTERTTH